MPIYIKYNNYTGSTPMHNNIAYYKHAFKFCHLSL